MPWAARLLVRRLAVDGGVDHQSQGVERERGHADLWSSARPWRTPYLTGTLRCRRRVASAADSGRRSISSLK